MHISVHVRSGNVKTSDLQLTTHCLTIFVALDDQRQPTPVQSWEPIGEEDQRLDRHAQHLMELRSNPTPHPA